MLLPKKTRVFNDGNPYHVETSPVICRSNEGTGFYMIGTSVMKELMQLSSYNTERSGAFFQSSDSVKHLQVVSSVSCMLSHENFHVRNAKWSKIHIAFNKTTRFQSPN